MNEHASPQDTLTTALIEVKSIHTAGRLTNRAEKLVFKLNMMR